MRKHKLNLDHLNVESFTPTPGELPYRGTVRANEYTWDGGSCDTCICESVEYTCDTTSRPSLGYTRNDYTCMGETCYPAKTCANPE